MTWQKPFQWDGKDKSLIRLNSKENKRKKIEESIDYLLRNLPPQTSREMGATDGNSFGLMKRSSQGHGLHFFLSVGYLYAGRENALLNQEKDGRIIGAMSLSR